MGKILKLSAPGGDDMGGDEMGYTDPYARAIDEARRKLAQPQAPMFSPEQVEQRRAENQQQYMLGVLGQLSGDPNAGAVGGQVFKQALAARQPRVTERGVADPISGEFKYNADYLRERDEQTLAGLQQRSAQARGQFEERRIAAGERRQLAQERAAEQRALRAMMAGNRQEPLVSVTGPNGEAMYVPRSQAVGLKPASVGGGGQPTGDERNAAGFAARMQSAESILASAGELGGAEGPLTSAVGALPWVGKTTQTLVSSGEQNRFRQAAADWIRAKLRKESGASISPTEFEGEYQTYFPQPFDSAEVRAQKADARAIATAAMRESAGRASNTVSAIAGAGRPEAPAGADPYAGFQIRPKGGR